MSKWLDADVIGKIQWTDRNYSLRLSSPGVTFTAGQFIRVGMDLDGEVVARPYSLVNAPAEPDLEIFFNIIPEGPLTPRLSAMEAGDRVKVANRASGFLVIDEVPQCEHLWMFATGTGVGPFLSILKTPEPWQRFSKVVLVYSVRAQEELAYQDVIREIEASHPGNFVYVPAVTREIVAGAMTQRITSALQSGELEELGGIPIKPETSHVMMCGNPDMIRTASELLSGRGMKKHLRRDPGHFTIEKYH